MTITELERDLHETLGRLQFATARIKNAPALSRTWTARTRLEGALALVERAVADLHEISELAASR